MTVERGVGEQLSDYYEPVAGFEDISGMQARFSAEIAQKLSNLGPDNTTVIIPLIGGMYQWWRLQEIVPELVCELQLNALFVARDYTNKLKLSKNVASMPHVVVLDDIGDELTQSRDICKLTEVQCAENIHFFSPVRKVHTRAKMEVLNTERRARNLPEIDFFIPYCFPNDESGKAPWVCSGFGMDEGPDVSNLPPGNFRGSLASLAASQRMSTVCYKRKPAVLPRYSMEIQLFGLAAELESLRERNRLIDLETYKGDWQQQFRMIQRWLGE